MKIAIVGFDEQKALQLAKTLSESQNLKIIADPEKHNFKQLLELDYDKYFYAYHFQEMMDRYRDLQTTDSYILIDSYLHDEGAIEVAYKSRLLSANENILFQDKCKDYTNLLSMCDAIYFISTLDTATLFKSQAISHHLPMQYFEECYRLYELKMKQLRNAFSGTWIDVKMELLINKPQDLHEETSIANECDNVVENIAQPGSSVISPIPSFYDQAKAYFSDYLPDVVIVEDDRLKKLIEIFQQGKDLSSNQYAAIKDDTISCLRIVNDEKITVDEFLDFDKIRAFFDQVHE